MARHDYLPFGEEIPSGYANRGADWAADDSVKQKFTGQERDQETGLDYFGARYFSAAQGRFTSADPSGLFFADPTNPQSLNLYGYVLNNPLRNIDRDGLRCVWDDGSFDSEDDADTGSQGQCEAQGESWYDAGTYASGTDWASTNPDGTLTLYGAAPSQSVTVTGTATGVEVDTTLWLSGYWANVGIAITNATNTLIGSGGSSSQTPYYRFFMTHYCGPGGAGATTGVMDQACKAHDACFASAGLDASVNVSTSGVSLNLQQASMAQACNQALYNAARSNPRAHGSASLQLWLTKGDQTPFRGFILAPGTEAKPW
jgi:RHS repeat-associated protein